MREIKFRVWFGSVGSRYGTLTAYRSKKGIEVTRGCFHGTLEEFEKAVKERHRGTNYEKESLILIEYIRHRLGTC